MVLRSSSPRANHADPRSQRQTCRRLRGAFHDVVADFEELEAPALRREPDQPGLGHSLTERLIALRLLQGAIDECRHRSIRVPREIHRLRAAISRQIYSRKALERWLATSSSGRSCLGEEYGIGDREVCGDASPPRQ